MGVHHIKMALIERFPGVTGLIMRYEPGTGAEVYTVTIDGRNEDITLFPGAKEEVVIDAIANAIAADTAEPSHDTAA